MILEHKLRNRVVIYGLKCVKLPKIDLPSYFFFVPLSSLLINVHAYEDY